jgi:HEAT repeat protein
MSVSPPKKILESSPLSGLTVPLAIILVGALIIFGVTKMLSTGKNHRDLVEELNSKTFGNRWIAAYELSKFVASQKIPKEDLPWVIENLSQVYFESVDARTRNFIVLTLGALKSPLVLSTLNKALSDEDPHVKFNSLVALGNMTVGAILDWDKIEELSNLQGDSGIRQAALLCMASHNFSKAQAKALEFLQSSDNNLRYTAALVLVKYKDTSAISVINEIFALGYDSAKSGLLNGAQVEGLKVSLLENIQKASWTEMLDKVAEVEKSDPNVRVTTKAKLALKILKN